MHVPCSINFSGSTASSESSIFIAASLKSFWAFNEALSTPLSKQKCGEKLLTPLGHWTFLLPRLALGSSAECVSRALHSCMLPFWFYTWLVQYSKLGTESVTDCGFGALLLLWQDAWGDSCTYFWCAWTQVWSQRILPCKHPFQGVFMCEATFTTPLSCLGVAIIFPWNLFEEFKFKTQSAVIILISFYATVNPTCRLVYPLCAPSVHHCFPSSLSLTLVLYTALPTSLYKLYSHLYPQVSNAKKAQYLSTTPVVFPDVSTHGFCVIKRW